jgi:protein SCO1
MKNLLQALHCVPLFILMASLLVINSTYADYNSAKVERHLGKTVPQNLKFKNSKGKEVLLKDLINKPTVLDFCYYRCAGICTPLMVEIASVIGKVKYDPGKDYRIISISIDQNETPAMAAQKKRIMMKLINIKIPDSAWTFLTGDSTNIYKLTDAAGFEFKRTYGGFQHKGVLVFADKTGRIVRYMNPNYTRKGDFQILPAAFELSLDDASNGVVKSTIANVLTTCYSFIPKGKDAYILLVVLFVGLLTMTTVIVIIKKAKIKNI